MNKLEENRFIFLGLKFSNHTMDKAIENLEYFIQTGSPHIVFTPTAELIVKAQENSEIRDIYNKAHLLTLDSFVVYYSARLCGKKVKEPVSAVRLMFNFLKIAQQKKYRLYLLGAKKDVVQKVVEVLNKQYPGINIVGWQDGYFDLEKDKEIVSDIIDKKPDVLFVAISSPLKEKFISKNVDKMRVPVSMGVGGSFDIIAGKCHLAPEWVSRLGFEWFYRLIQEPSRLWKRYLVTNTKFLYLVIKEFFKTQGGK